jgi:hypothetical protein
MMKLFVWEKPYPVSYGMSCVYAVAETVEEAREVAKRGNVLSYDILWDLDRPDLKHKGNRRDTELGEPTRILDLPCAEWREWSE